MPNAQVPVRPHSLGSMIDFSHGFLFKLGPANLQDVGPELDLLASGLGKVRLEFKGDVDLHPLVHQMATHAL